MSPAPTTWIDCLEAGATEHDHAVLYRFLTPDAWAGEHRSLSYTGLATRARAIGQHLGDQVAPGEPVLLVFAPGLGFIEAFFGCLYAGAAAVPVAPPSPGRLTADLERLRGIVSSAGATVALCDRLVASVAGSLPGADRLTWIVAADIESERAASWSAPAVTAESLALIQHTSGSTRAPRGVAITHGQLLENQRFVQAAFGHDPARIQAHGGDFGVSWLPLHHDMGLIGHVLHPLFIGALSNLLSPLDFLARPARWLEAVSHFRAHTSGGPDFGYRLAARKVSKEAVEDLDLSAWRVAYCGAEPVRAESLRAFADHLQPAGFDPRTLYPTYGLAEATLFVTGGESGGGVTEWRDDDQTHVCCGTPRGDTVVRIVDPDTRAPLDDGETGEVWVRGPCVARTYWRDEAATRETFGAQTAAGEGPFLRTGDLGLLRDGRLTVTGRLKDLIILAGRNVYPQDLEATAESAHPAIRPGCCAAFPVDSVEGERAAVVVEVRGGIDVHDHHEILGAIRRRLLRHQGVRVATVALCEARTLPKTSSGKLRRHACRQALLDGSLRVLAIHADEALPGVSLVTLEELVPLAPDARRDRLAQSLRDVLADRLAVTPDDLPLDVRLDALGIDSLAVVDLAAEFDVRLGLVLDPQMLMGSPTLGAIAQGLLEALDDED